MSVDYLSYPTKQLAFDIHTAQRPCGRSYLDTLTQLLKDDLDFHKYNSGYATHNFHSFPAKFPPQLPAKFILSLTQEGQVVLDPMMGSGTTVVEAFLNGRKAVGFDIDHLAVRIAKVKTGDVRVKDLVKYRASIIGSARDHFENNKSDLRKQISDNWDPKTKQFINFWFAPETQLELMALVHEITRIREEPVRAFFEVALSATIITKSGGVSLALDLGHTRPHKAKAIIDKDGSIIFSGKFESSKDNLARHHTKRLRSALDEFERRCTQNLNSLGTFAMGSLVPDFAYGNAQCLPIRDESIDLIVTSPPYASNAIDYMRAHKFSLIWLGYTIDELSLRRKKYIGSENTSSISLEKLPHETTKTIHEISNLDNKRGKVLHRYYSEMTRMLQEIFRVLKPQKAAVIVVGSSAMRGKDTNTPRCLAEIGRNIGFHVPTVGVRQLDRNKRMLPAGNSLNSRSQIQQRMHKEYVIGFYKE